MMDEKVNYATVGLFVIILFAAFILSVIWLSAGFNTVTYTTYQVYMKESVAGLNVDSSVKYNGMDVGYVKDIQLSQRDTHIIVLWLNIKKGIPITMGTTATLKTQGITGIMYVALIDNGTHP